jgi:GAF domain-containing protein
MSDYKTKGSIDFPLLDNIFGWPILHGRPIISNDPSHDDRRSGRQPPGHPPLDSFLGVPIHKGDTVVGLFGVANRTGGYTDEQAKSLETLARTASVIYESYKRLQHEQSLLQDRSHTEEQLKQSNQQLLDLAYVVSHELQEPLRTIRSELSLLSVRYSDRLGEDADNFISNSVRAAGIVERMVDDLWEYARIDRPHMTSTTYSTNLSNLSPTSSNHAAPSSPAENSQHSAANPAKWAWSSANSSPTPSTSTPPPPPKSK